MKHSGISMADIAPRYRDQIASQMKITPATDPVVILRPVALNPSKDEDGLNKTERAFLEHLRRQDWEWIGIQCLTLKIGDRCRYTPDFAAMKAGRIVLWEVKGFWRDDARVKIKTAARAFPFFNFIAVQRKGRTAAGWTVEKIAP
jgi:predicted nuclease of restriction endonuclease-like RecB superfamily